MNLKFPFTELVYLFYNQINIRNVLILVFTDLLLKSDSNRIIYYLDYKYELIYIVDSFKILESVDSS